MTNKTHKAGFVNIIGKPNVGKSTLMNALVGEKLSIITSKAQTTRHRIQGIVNGEDFQIVYSDTPGILLPNYKLQENMLKASRSALVDADILLYVTEAGDEPSQDYPFLDKIQKAKIPVLLVINKIDLSDQEKLEELHNKWAEILPKATIIPLSALKKFNLDLLFKLILDFLPEGEAYYSKEELSDKSERFFAGEIIREKILLNYKKEIPYSVEIEIPEFKEDEKIIRIEAIIFVERETQKGILIGKAGLALKQTGTDARLDMEKFFNKKVFLSMVVKVKKDWRNNENNLRSFGYR
ncbi:MAG: GTPase Era [Bacteroidales bacterium]|nr:GTPase Era [Bacteroidales bacterium]MCF8389963.1 GTPase Era [Bacteroidales bacterium]